MLVLQCCSILAISTSKPSHHWLCLNCWLQPKQLRDVTLAVQLPACRHLKATDPAKGGGLSVSVLVRHPTLGAYFDAHLLLQKCPEQQQCLPEQGGLASLLRQEKAAGAAAWLISRKHCLGPPVGAMC
jgi:hypothetical protein